MSHPYFHAMSSVKKHGGQVTDYLAIHQWFDATKSSYADGRHRALRHHSEGIFECEALYGPIVRNSDGKIVPVRVLGEQHVKEDLGWIPSVKDWLSAIDLAKVPWAIRGVQKLELENVSV